MIKIRARGQITRHGMLGTGASTLLEEYKTRSSKEESTGAFYFLLASLMFSAFQAEGSINTVGWKLLQNAWPETLGWKDKVKLIYGISGRTADFGTMPLQILNELFSLRNGWAHAKPEIVDGEYEIANPMDFGSDHFRSDFERRVTVDFAERAEVQVEAFFNELLEVSKVEWHETTTNGIETGLD